MIRHNVVDEGWPALTSTSTSVKVHVHVHDHVAVEKMR
jgi:hypothetical protein